jgi:DNA modification methylase
MIDNNYSVGEVKPNSVLQGDCLEIMKLLADKSIDMVLCDLPYG